MSILCRFHAKYFCEFCQYRVNRRPINEMILFRFQIVLASCKRDLNIIYTLYN